MIIEIIDDSIGIVAFGVDSEHNFFIRETMLPDALNPLFFFCSHFLQ
jgi:hypothetical protein